MHLRATKNQMVRIPAENLLIEFAEGETIWTESGHKYSIDEIPPIAADADFCCFRQGIDEQWPFTENLLIAE